MKTTTDFQLVATDKLIPYANNARTHSPEQIKKLRSSLREFGFVNPVIIDREYNVIAGHGRLMAAKEEAQCEPPDQQAPRPARLSHRQLHAGERCGDRHLRRQRLDAHGL